MHKDCSKASAPVACRALDGALGGWYMRSYSNNLLFIVVMLTSLKVNWDNECPFKPSPVMQTA